MSDVLRRLAATIAARRGADPAASHTAAMLEKGAAKCAEKFGEEAVEAIVAAVRCERDRDGPGDGGDQNDRDALAAEGADVLYHFLVMLEAAGVGLDEVLAELERREGTSGVAEKAARKKG